MTDLSYEILCSSCRAAIPSTSEACPACGQSLRRVEVLPRGVEREQPPEAVSIPAPAITPGLRADGRREYGGFGRRAAAVLVDDLVVGVPVFLIIRTFGAWGVLALLVTWLYDPIMESSRSQATIGKIAFGLIVTDTSFRRISFGRAVGRYFSKILSGLILYVGFLMVAFTPQKRGLHDYIAGTVVLRV